MQTRALSGTDFEKTLETNEWIRKEIKPKMVWDVAGKTVFHKMKNVNYDVTKFNLHESSVISKSDFIYHTDPTLRFEVKRYNKSQFKKWTLYSEPFFKVAKDKSASYIDVDTYNKFVNDFFDKRKDIQDRVIQQVGTQTLGIRCLDGFIPQQELQYKIQVRKAWRGYLRLTVMCKLKD